MGGSSRPEIEALENKILICRNCHTEITEHRWSLTRSTSELVVTQVASGEVISRRRFNASFDAPAFLHGATLVEHELEALLPGIPYLTDDQLVELFHQLRTVDKGSWKAQAAILWEAKQRSIYSDRAWEAMGRTFGIGWRQAYNLARVWKTFFLDEQSEFCIRMQNSSLEEVTWYVVASETDSPQFWLQYAEDQKSVDPSYSISDFKEEIVVAGAAEKKPCSTSAEKKKCRWLRVYCEKLDRVVKPGQCPGCDIFPFIQEALR
jgi:hypothetical protein